MKTERLIDLSRPGRKSFGDGAARRVEVSGNRHKTGRRRVPRKCATPPSSVSPMAAERAVMAVLIFLSLSSSARIHIAAAFAKRSRYFEG